MNLEDYKKSFAPRISKLFQNDKFDVLKNAQIYRKYK